MEVDIQTKLRLALGSMKDHASIGKAMIYNHDAKAFSHIDIAVLRATAHDNGPVEDKYMQKSSSSSRILPDRSLIWLKGFHNGSARPETSSSPSKLFPSSTVSSAAATAPSNESCVTLTSPVISKLVPPPTVSSTPRFRSYAATRPIWKNEWDGPLHKPGNSNRLCSTAWSSDVTRRSRSTWYSVSCRNVKTQEFLDRVLDCLPIDIVPPADNLAQATMANTLKESFQVYIMHCEGIEILINMFFDLTTPARTLAYSRGLLDKAKSLPICTKRANEWSRTRTWSIPVCR
ncbi:putative clathrin assembly protein [Hibiscus syriacus]|uniref:Clathrin assembly protein n=1 Tax=Hibiscus syriacus TaxID=106335 RepID=A0A6A2YZ60_HIBSY|nr:putative clathrin assembly protein [Hibiscus syriacus]